MRPLECVRAAYQWLNRNDEPYMGDIQRDLVQLIDLPAPEMPGDTADLQGYTDEMSK